MTQLIPIAIILFLASLTNPTTAIIDDHINNNDDYDDTTTYHIIGNLKAPPKRKLQSLISPATSDPWNAPDDPLTISFPAQSQRLRTHNGSQQSQSSQPRVDGGAPSIFKFSTDDNAEYESPDIWDIFAWMAAKIGRLLRLVAQALYKFIRAIYIGAQYGWSEDNSKPTVSGQDTATS